MKITDIQTHVCRARTRNWIFVKVITDQLALYGCGEATFDWRTDLVTGEREAPVEQETLQRVFHRGRGTGDS